MLYQEILDFYHALSLDQSGMPDKVRVMNPYRDEETKDEVGRLLEVFHKKYFNDRKPRGIILGINPGRKGAGLTGIPFTDSPALKEVCDIDTEIETRETSSEFVYKLVQAYGGPQAFYGDWFIGAACPLGFLHLNDRGNWINWNYYDQEELYEAVKPFMKEQLMQQKALCGGPESAIVWGTGKNMKYLQKLNKEYGIFKELIPLEHPRFVMQYRRKRLEEYLGKFSKVLEAHRPTVA